MLLRRCPTLCRPTPSSGRRSRTRRASSATTSSIRAPACPTTPTEAPRRRRT
jgi:hypothetical protein